MLQTFTNILNYKNSLINKKLLELLFLMRELIENIKGSYNKCKIERILD
jgi:hypothetical protein